MNSQFLYQGAQIDVDSYAFDPYDFDPYAPVSSPVIEGTKNQDERFGSAMVAGDFNGDGIADIGVGSEGETVGAQYFAGALNVVMGSTAGLTGQGNQQWTQNSPGVKGSAGYLHSFGGNSLTVGDFNGDGKDDVATGVGEDVNFAINSGSVSVLFGSDSGLTSAGNQSWNQASRGMEGSAEEGDRFGSSLAAGDFDGDGKDDLAVGVSGEDIGTTVNAGAVDILYGSRNGLTANGHQRFFQGRSGLRGTVEADDEFGNSLATGDFNGDGKDDLAVGAWLEDIRSIEDAGAVNVLYGSRSGLTTQGNQMWSQNSSGVQGESSQGGNFGNSLATGDFNGDGKDDLAVGSVKTDSHFSGGAVTVLHGSNSGLTSRNSQLWTQDSLGVQGTAEDYERFGETLTVGDFNGDGFDDLAIGITGEDVNGNQDAGAVSILYGSVDGLTAVNNQLWTQDSFGFGEIAEAFDTFGSSLTSGDFNGDGYADLSIGVSGEGIGGVADAGAAHILYGSSSGLSAF